MCWHLNVFLKIGGDLSKMGGVVLSTIYKLYQTELAVIGLWHDSNKDDTCT